MKVIEIDNKFSLIKSDIELGYMYFIEEANNLIIKEVYVYPGYRGNGFGKLLVDHITLESKERGRNLFSECRFAKNFVKDLKR